MKVLQINSVYKTGSTGWIVSALQNLIKDTGNEAFVLYGRGINQRNNEAYKFTSNLEIYKHVLITRLLDKHGLSSNDDTNFLIEKIREYSPDIIHLHNIHGYYLNYEMLFEFLVKYNRPVVWTLHDCWCFTGHCAYFTMCNCNKWKIECKDCVQKKRYPISWFVDNSQKNYLAKKRAFTSLAKDKLVLVTPSVWLRDLVEQSFLKKYRVKVIRNGVNLSDYNVKRERNVSEYRKKIIAVAYPWGERKGLSHVIEIANKIPDDILFTVVGLTNKQKELFPKKTNLILLNKTNNKSELISLYNEADVFVNTTLEDNYPTVNLEALAAGLPVITYPTGGSAESVNMMGGAVTDSCSVDDLIRTVNSFKGTVIDNKDFIDEKKVYVEYLNLYDELNNINKK